MKLIEINPELDINDKTLTYSKPSIEKFITENKDKDNFPVRNNLPDTSIVFHDNYLEYLEKCWASHYQVVLTPDIIWYTLLAELSSIVKNKPESYRSLFTKSLEKTEISVCSDDLEVLPLDKITECLKNKVPNDFAEMFLPKFSTTTQRSELAHQAAFADTVSPYYSYSMYLCGISSIRLEGTTEDWDVVLNNWENITNLLTEIDNKNNIYYNKVTDILAEIPNGEPEFFMDIFYAKKCGSGSEIELYGWFTDLYRIQPKGVRKSCNFSSHISLVNYKHLQTKKNYVMKTGIFSSSIKELALEPEFSYIVYEKNTN